MTERVAPSLVERFRGRIELDGRVPEIPGELHAAGKIPQVGRHPPSVTRDAKYLGQACGRVGYEIEEESGDGDIDVPDLAGQCQRISHQEVAAGISDRVARLLD